MRSLVAAFPSQLEESIGIADRYASDNSGKSFNNILICGLGGSGIGGTIFSQVMASELAIPVVSCKDYTIPAFVSESTLVLACSYSGNTEETLEALEQCVASGATISAITSGGKLLDMAKENGWPVIELPGGYPPRAAFAFPFVQIFRLVQSFGLISSGWRDDMQAAQAHLEANTAAIEGQAAHIAAAIGDGIPAIYADASFEGVATRWRQQINENAKSLCWHHAYPEMNHNELVGWKDKNDSLTVIMLRNKTDHKRTQKRMDLTSEVYGKLIPEVHECWSEGDSTLVRTMHLIHLGDWVSMILAERRKRDATEVHVIDWLKGELAKF